MAAAAPAAMERLLRLPPPVASPPSHHPNNPLLSALFLSAARPSTSPRISRLSARACLPVPSVYSSSPSPPVEAAPAAAAPRTKWVVVMEKPPDGRSSRSEVVDYYVETLARVLGSEKEAQMCIYDASWQDCYGFCCVIDEEASRQISGLPGVLSVKPDLYPESERKDYGYSNFLLASLSKSDVRASKFSSSGENCEYWLVRVEKPAVEVVTKAQMVDYYAQILTKVMGNEKDAQVSIYHISWEKDFGFCCRIDEECARELADVPGVLSVQPDVDFLSDNKNYRGGELRNSEHWRDSSETNQIAEVKTKRLFVTGLSFYTSEKTLRAAFEPFGELVEVKVIMDKISKRSKGYAFIEYTTEEAAGAALKEMNGKIINGWMIVVDVAKANPPKYGRGQPRPPTSSASLY